MFCLGCENCAARSWSLCGGAALRGSSSLSFAEAIAALFFSDNSSNEIRLLGRIDCFFSSFSFSKLGTSIPSSESSLNHLSNSLYGMNCPMNATSKPSAILRMVLTVRFPLSESSAREITPWVRRENSANWACVKPLCFRRALIWKGTNLLNCAAAKDERYSLSDNFFHSSLDMFTFLIPLSL
jgi:hypothetical protein